MDISKGYDTINRELLLTKPKAYDLSKNTLSLMCSYLKNCKQGHLIHNSISTTKKSLQLLRKTAPALYCKMIGYLLREPP